MKINDDEILDFTIYIVKRNSGEILKCFGNEENAYLFATQECFKYTRETLTNKHIFENIYNVDADLDADYTTKYNIIHENYNLLIQSDICYHYLAIVEEHSIDTNDIYI